MKLLSTIVLCATLFCAGCEKPPTPEEKWVANQNHRCSAMGSTGHYDKGTKQFECWRHPIARQAKLMFKEAYRGS